MTDKDIETVGKLKRLRVQLDAAIECIQRGNYRNDTLVRVSPSDIVIGDFAIKERDTFWGVRKKCINYMHQENLVGNPADLDALIKDRPPTLQEIAEKDADRIEQELRERVSRRPPPNLVLESKAECCCKTIAPALPTATELLGRQAWSLKCLLQDIRSTSKVLYGEQRANAKLAVRHIEDALHRINLALEE